MKCSIIRDLLPLYIEKECSPQSTAIIEEHLQSCSECRKLYEDMSGELGLKDLLTDTEDCDFKRGDRDLWRRYYGGLFLKGLGLFALVYVICMIVGILVYGGG